MPGLKIAYPSTPGDAKGLLRMAIDDPNPVLFFEHKYLYRSLTGPVPEEDYLLEFGKGRVVREGQDATLITYGLGVQWAEAVLTAHPEWDVEVIDLRTLLPWDEVKEVTFECEPGTLTDKKLKTLHEIGVTRLSLGVENFDDHILEINGRAHRGGEIDRAYGYAREVGFQQINIDLIAGMLDETEDNWKACVAKAIEMAPDSITVYQMEVPYNTTIYKRMKEEGKLAAPVADWDTKRRWTDYAYNELAKNGYTVTSAYTAVKDSSKVTFEYRDQLWAGADLLSVGVASFGHIGGTHYQNHHDFDPYVEQLGNGDLPVYRALTPGDDERLIREFILQLKLGSVSLQYFTDKFGTNPAERFAEPLQRIADWGFLTIEGDRVNINREGLLQVDRLLHEFFLPEHRNARYA